MKNIIQRLYLPFGFVFFGLLFAMMIQTALAAIGPDCDPADDIADCTVTPTFTSLLVGDGVMPADGDLKITDGKAYTGAEAGWDFTDILGYELTNITGGDFISTNDIFVDNAAFIDGWIMGGRYMITTDVEDGGAPSSYDDGDIAATDDLWADDSIVASSGTIKTGVPSSVSTTGDIVATDDLLADDDVIAGDQVTAVNVIKTTLNTGTIGRFYTVTQSPLYYLNDGDTHWTSTVYCSADDYVTGCAGYLYDNDSEGGAAFFGTDVNGNGCKAKGNGGGGASDNGLAVTAFCFSPNG